MCVRSIQWQEAFSLNIIAFKQMSPVRIAFQRRGSAGLMSERHSPVIYPLSNGCSFYLSDKDLTVSLHSAHYPSTPYQWRKQSLTGLTDPKWVGRYQSCLRNMKHYRRTVTWGSWAHILWKTSLATQHSSPLGGINTRSRRENIQLLVINSGR